MTATNLLIICSDEHMPDAMGCAGHPEVLTPNLDRLATRGTRFLNAACASPICVPARAAMVTGRNIFETGYWDNVDAYDGKVPGWQHVLRDAGHEVASIGKLHYRGWEGDDYGYASTFLPMHIHNGHGELRMLLRNPPVNIGDGSNMLNSAGPGTSSYNRYDDQICSAAQDWLRQRAAAYAARAAAGDAKPWVLQVTMVAPHFPLTVPAEFYDLYANRPLRLPKDYAFGVNGQAHPYVQQYGRASGYNLHFRDEADVRRALAAYYGLITFMDHKVGVLLDTLAATGLDANTRVIYLADHGENAGARGLWGKSTMYRESVGIPLITAGPGVAAGATIDAAVSHIDLYATVLDAVGVPPGTSTASPRSQSLFGPLDPDRAVLSEYHAFGSRAGVTMLQDRHGKYVHYCDLPAQLFDLRNDPAEQHDLAGRPEHATTLAAWHERLLALMDPADADRRARARQDALVEHYGGREAILASAGIGGYTPAPVA